MTDQVIEFGVGVGGAVIVRDVAVKVTIETCLFCFVSQFSDKLKESRLLARSSGLVVECERYSMSPDSEMRRGN